MTEHSGEKEAIHTADDGYCIAECSHGLGASICGLQVVRPGKFQCWCDGLSDEAITVYLGRNQP